MRQAFCEGEFTPNLEALSIVLFVPLEAPPLNDRRLIEVLNDVARSFAGIWDTGAARSGDAASLEAWAGFLSACVAKGVSIGDPRWRDLEVRVRAGQPRFALPPDRIAAQPPLENDFSVGLTLLMGLLDRQPESRPVERPSY